MIPEKIPVFTADDLLKPPIQEYEKGDRKSTVGWLKFLFMWQQNGKYLQITPQDRKDYLQAEKTFRKVNNIAKDLHDWEDSTPVAKQVKALNKFRKAMGYTHVCER